MKRIVIYARYAKRKAFSTRNCCPRAVTSGTLRASALNIRSGQRLQRRIFSERLRLCDESHGALGPYSESVLFYFYSNSKLERIFLTS